MVPDGDHLGNFKVHGTGSNPINLLVLDNYGNERLPDKFAGAIWGGRVKQFSYTLAINTDTGQTYFANFGLEGDDLILILTEDYLPKVPKAMLPRLDALLSRKRPFWFELQEAFLRSYISRWVGLERASEFIMVGLDLGRTPQVPGSPLKRCSLYLWGEDTSYRFVDDWKDAKTT